MANYFEMTQEELSAEKARLEEEYQKFQAMGLKLNMALTRWIWLWDFCR